MRPLILCVDDQSDITKAVSLILRKDEYEVDTFNDPKEGLEAAKHKEYALALVDIRMPGMTGIEFFTQLKEFSPRTIKINMSSHADLEIVLEALSENNVYDFIKKPFKHDKFLATIKKGLDYYRLRIERDQLSERLKTKNAKLESWNKNLDEEVKKKTLELSIRDRLMQHLAACAPLKSDAYAIIREYFSKFVPASQFAIYQLKEQHYHLNTKSVTAASDWVELMVEDESQTSGEIDQAHGNLFTKSDAPAYGYIKTLDRNGRRIGMMVLLQTQPFESSQIELIKRFATLVTLVIYDELASEKLSQLSLVSLLQDN